MIFKRKAAGQGVSTIVGRWFLVSLFESDSEKAKYNSMLNGGVAGWSYDEPAVLDALCAVAVRRYFGNIIDFRAINAFAADVSGRLQEDVSPPTAEEVGAFIYLALGDRDYLPVVRKMSLADRFYTQGCVAARIIFELNISRKKVVDMIVQAERRALERGWKPPLLT